MEAAEAWPPDALVMVVSRILEEMAMPRLQPVLLRCLRKCGRYVAPPPSPCAPPGICSPCVVHGACSHRFSFCCCCCCCGSLEGEEELATKLAGFRGKDMSFFDVSPRFQVKDGYRAAISELSTIEVGVVTAFLLVHWYSVRIRIQLHFL